MSQAVSSASKIAVALAFRKARHKFPKNFGCISEDDKCHNDKKQISLKENGKCNDTDENNNNLNNKEICEKCSQELISINSRRGENNKICQNCNKGRLEIEEFKHVNPVDIEEEFCRDGNKRLDLPSSKTCPLHNVHPKGAHHCNKCYRNDFTKNLLDWEHRIQKESTVRSKRTCHQMKLTTCIKNSSKTDLDQSHTIYNHYHYHRLRLKYCFHCRYCQSKKKVRNVELEKSSKNICQKSLSLEQIDRKLIENISEDESGITDMNKLKHKDSVLILMEKLAIGKKNSISNSNEKLKRESKACD